MPDAHSVVMLGATGAVGSNVAHTLVALPGMGRLTLLGRRPLEGISGDFVAQHTIDIFESASYQDLLPGHSTAICTLGVGQPSKVSRNDYIRIDKLAVLEFATACKRAGVRHFELLCSVGADSGSRSFFLRIKGELEDELRALDFERLSLFQPSMILTPTNRYGLSQAITLAVWPLLRPLLLGPLRKFRGVPVRLLGRAMAVNIVGDRTGVETLHWDDFIALAKASTQEIAGNADLQSADAGMHP